MKKILIFLLCILLSVQTFAADIEITEDFEVKVNKEALLAALYEADIESLRQAIDLKLVSCYELTSYYLERIEAYNDTFHCFVTLCDNALEIARQRDEAIANGTATGKLFGIPIVVKDNIDYEGFLTTNGKASGTMAPKNATVVQNLLDEGAVILGKTHMSAGAQDAICSVSDTGLHTYNAYNPNLASGGSSGGSAVAVSLNFAVAGLGTDTNSSLRYPSALNGCISLRTTTGLLSRDGCVILNPSRDTVGTITRSVKDQAIMLDAMSANAYGFTQKLNSDALDGLRIGVLSELSYPINSSYDRSSVAVDKEILTAFDNALTELESCGAEIVMIDNTSVLSEIEADQNLSKTLERILNENQVSALIYPAYLHTPHYDNPDYLGGKSVYDLPYITNCNGISSRSGAPEITVPIGQHSSGAGIAMEIISFQNNDQLLLDIAYSYTIRYNHRQEPETAPTLYFGETECSLQDFLKLYEQKTETAERLSALPNQPPVVEPVQPTEVPAVSKPSSRLHPQSIESKNYNFEIWLVAVPLSIVLLVCGVFLLKKKKTTVKK